jgi:hypothetical protein
MTCSTASFPTPVQPWTCDLREGKVSADHKWNQMKFECGDISTQLIKTHLGRTIMVQWDETNPRPYSRHDLITGKKGTLAGYPERAAIEGRGSYHEWIEGDDFKKLYAEYEHPLYKRMGDLAVKMGGHGGMVSSCSPALWNVCATANR